MRTLISVLTISTLLIAADSALQDDDGPPPSFLKPGNDYILRFAGKSPFKQTEGIPLDPYDNKGPNTARITSASITYFVSIFTVVELWGDSWVTVEHPKSIKDAFKWNFKRLAIAALTAETIAKLEATEDGQAHLVRLRKQASVEIETDRTWVNLNQIVAIAKPPTEPQDFKLNTKVQARD
ncbi:hypothetical protein [Adhaeretor mobilis]|uniref:Uncharacterized protein n=1 Tax=Adhaeretor mobilis TaxID=1930276 RepID=A0A517MZZ3_9BACT|nr:hypothetical protein [Adhaeretor mobilis]QDT00451.1 hypothetical protein HG15A2_37890 [Adhaeretor mobilis]